MPSTFTPLGFNKQGPGENENAWGDILNEEAIDLIDQAIRGRTAFSLSGAKTLTSDNGQPNESRGAILHITAGSGGTVTIPDLSKLYVVINAATGPVVISAGGVTVATVAAGETAQVVADGQAAVRKVVYSDFGGARLTNVANPVNGQDAATKAYADSLAFQAVNLPGQGAGTAGKVIQSNGATASWQAVDVADVEGLDAELADLGAAIAAGDAATLLAARDLAIAFAVSL